MTRLKWASHADLAIRRQATVGRQEYLDHMTFRRNDRPLFTEIFGPIIGLKEEWEAQGATPSELDFSAFRYRCESRFWIPARLGAVTGLRDVPLSETDDARIYRDHLGRTMKLPKGYASLALPQNYPVRTMDDWRRVKSWYRFDESRLDPGWETAARQARTEDRVLVVGMPGGFDEPRQLMGEEALCEAYYDQPELVHDMLATFADTALKVLDRVSKSVPIDVLFVHEDMAGKSGPLIGPAQVAEFIAPYYGKVWDLAREHGARLFDQDSDGDMKPVLDAFLEAGVNCMHPMEPAAGMDIVQVREQFGTRLAFYGGLDKHVLRDSRAAIDRELETKIPPLLRTGGCVFALDHRVPNGTPMDHYRHYIRRVWEILDAWEGRLSPR